MPFWNQASPVPNAALRQAIDRSLAVITFDVDGHILDANANFLAVMGYRLDEIKGQHHRLFVDPAEADGDAYRQFWASLRDGAFRDGEFRRVARDGREVWLNATYNPVLDGSGKVTRIVKIASDITAAKTRSIDDAGQIAAIHRSQAVIAFDVDGHILDANANFLAVMGYGLDEIRGRHHSLFVPPQDAESPAYRAFWAALRRGEFQSAEYRRLAKGGREVWIRATYNPILDSQGNVAKVVKFAVDITAEKQRNADYEGQIAAINRTQAVITFTLDGHILDANDNFLTVMGYSRAEIVGQHHRLFVEKSYAASDDYATFWDRLRQGQPVSAIYQRFARGGKPVWLQATYNPILDLMGRPVKVVKYATDITASMGARARAVIAADDTLNNVETVAAAAEEMNAQTAHIADSMLRAKDAVDKIHARTGAAGASTGDMRQAAQAMDGVVQLIAQVAGQINLLALNATIESARAGEAGKGFAVVANEVKILAAQTSAATKRISTEINGMQALADQVVAALSQIGTAVGEVQGFVDSASGAMQEQSLVTRDISENMHVATEGVASIGRNLDDWIIGMEERRFDQRTRMAKPGTIFTPDGRVYACSLRNLSSGGAKLVTPNARDIPDTFRLEVPEEDINRRCMVLRRGRGDIGVRFLDAASAAA